MVFSSSLAIPQRHCRPARSEKDIEFAVAKFAEAKTEMGI
jgi:hypothetical protein